MTAFNTVFDYLLSFGIAGFLFWILNGILIELRVFSTTGDVYDLGNYLWSGALVIILVFGAFWFIRSLKEWQEVRR